MIDIGSYYWFVWDYFLNHLSDPAGFLIITACSNRFTILFLLAPTEILISCTCSNVVYCKSVCLIKLVDFTLRQS